MIIKILTINGGSRLSGLVAHATRRTGGSAALTEAAVSYRRTDGFHFSGQAASPHRNIHILRNMWNLLMQDRGNFMFICEK